jgi:hypothetical protein
VPVHVRVARFQDDSARTQSVQRRGGRYIPFLRLHAELCGHWAIWLTLRFSVIPLIRSRARGGAARTAARVGGALLPSLPHLAFGFPPLPHLHARGAPEQPGQTKGEASLPPDTQRPITARGYHRQLTIVALWCS